LLCNRPAKKTNEWDLNKAGVRKKLLKTVKTKSTVKLKLDHTVVTPSGNKGVAWKKIMQRTMAGACRRGRPSTASMKTSRRGQDSPWKSQSEWQKTEINGESTFMAWPTLGSRKTDEQNR